MIRKILTRENTTPLIVLFVSLLVLICISFSILDLLNHLLIGICGASIYILLLLLIAWSVSKIMGYKNIFTPSFIVSLCIIAFSMMFIIHIALTSSSYNLSFVDCMEYPFSNLTPAGAIFSFVIYPLRLLLPTEAVICLFVILMIVFFCVCVDKQFHHKHLLIPRQATNNSTTTEKVKLNKVSSKTQTMKVPNATMEKNKSMPTFISMPLTLNAKIEKDEKDKINDLVTPITPKPINIKKREPVKQTKVDPAIYSGIISSDNIIDGKNSITLQDAIDGSQVTPLKPQKFIFNESDETNLFDKPKTILQEKNTSEFKVSPVVDDFNEKPIGNFESKVDLEDDAFTKLGLSKQENNFSNQEFNTENIIFDNNKTNNASSTTDDLLNNLFNKEQDAQKTEVVKQEAPKPKRKAKYVRPPLELLTTQSSIPSMSQEKYEEKARIIEEKFEEFKISVKCVGVTRGPAITRYEFEMPQGVTVNKVLQYTNDISMVLESRKAIRIEAPIPGKNAFGIEVPNDKVDTIGLRDIIDTKQFREAPSPLTFALGKDITNRPVLSDVGKLVHTLVAGSTGSGKSVFMNAVIISLLYKSSPQDLRIILIDPKYVEFVIFENLPHLLLPKVVAEPAQAVSALAWACEEMERRNRVFAQYYVRSIDEYNDMPEVKDGTLEKMYKIVIMVDELGDLMISTRKEIEEKILKLTQKARSSGIHLILATQRPSVDVITGTIKANLPSRIAFALTNYNDSKTIIEQSGAEKLLGRGDMLYCPRGEEPTRLLGAFITQQEVSSIVKFIKEHNTCDYDPEIEKSIMVEKTTEASFGDGADATKDEYFIPVLRNAIETQICSISSIQRRFSIGYNRAARIVDELEARQYISKADGTKPRQIFITMEEFLRLYGDKG